MCLHGEMILKGIEIHFILFFSNSAVYCRKFDQSTRWIINILCGMSFYKASMQMELFSIQKIVIINSVHDREFELRNDEYLCTKKICSGNTMGWNIFWGRIHLFVWLVQSWMLTLSARFTPIQEPGVSN